MKTFKLSKREVEIIQFKLGVFSSLFGGNPRKVEKFVVEL